MGRGTLFSAVLHLVVILIAILGLPMFSNDWEPPEEAIPVELATVADMTNIPVRPQVKEPEEKPEPKPEAAPERVVRLDGPRPKVKPKRPPEEKPVDKLDLNKIAALLNKELTDPAQKTEELEEKPDQAEQELPPTEATRPTTSAQMTLSEIDSIKAQIHQCWSIPAGARYAETLVVSVRIYLRPDGSLAAPPRVEDGSRMYAAGEEAYRAAAESAVRAILKCEPFKNLPADKYDRWQDLQLDFNPSEMLGG